VTGTEQHRLILSLPLANELSQGFKISFGEAGIGKPVEEAEGGGGEEEEVERKE
jgi:hypothetical protein